MDALPIDAHLDEIAELVRERGALVLVAEPGAGKTTRVPPALVDRGVAGSGSIVMLEPRRVAARAAARRIAVERGDELGGFAGFQIRFERVESARTRVLVVTEGVLVRRLQEDPELAGVSIVLLDEFHERSLHGDLALALLQEVRATLRPDLKLVVMSATLEAEPVGLFLGAPVLRVAGRTHPLTIERLERRDDRSIAERATAGVRRALSLGTGGVLVFLPGKGEIARVREALAPESRKQDLELADLHGELSSEEQDRVLAPAPRRRIVLATNVAETSLTVPDISIVVDSGHARVPRHDADVGFDRLELKRIGKASAAQRAGRAGRLGPGRVLQLWTAAEETLMPERELPEIRRVDLASALLELAAWGTHDVLRFPWFEPPDPTTVERTLEALVRLGALDPGTRAITDLGRRMVRIPAHPRLARLLLEAEREGVAEEGALLAALLSERDLFAGFHDRKRSRPARGPSDLLARRDAFLAAERGEGELGIERGRLRAIGRAADQLLRALRHTRGGLARTGRASERGKAHPDPSELDATLLRVILAAYADRVARARTSGSREAVMLGGGGVVLGGESVLDGSELFVVIEAGRSPRDPKNAFVRQASAIREEWLAELFPGAVREERAVVFDPERERVRGLARRLFGDLVLEEVECGDVDAVRAKELLFEAARARPERVLALESSAASFLERARWLAGACPELGLPALAPGDLVLLLEPWADRAKSFADLRALPLLDVVRAALGHGLAPKVDELAPERCALPSGTQARLAYELGKPPVLAARLQELFGLADTPRVAAGRIAVILHLLAPNQRVVQITQDLRSFWDTTYARVRKDLRGRYPKHAWPEDPWTAVPTRRTKRAT